MRSTRNRRGTRSRLARRLALVACAIVAQITHAGLGAQQPRQPGPPPSTSNARAANTKSAVDEGVTYTADGRRLTLLRRTDQIAVQFRVPAGPQGRAAADAALSRLIAAGGPLADFRPGRALSGSLRVLQHPGAAADATPAGLRRHAARMRAAENDAKQSGDVAWAVAVFVNEETGTTMVANDEVIVALEQWQDPASVFADARFTGFRPLSGTDDQFIGTVAAGGGEAAIALANEIAKHAGVVWASPNFYQELGKQSVNDALYPIQWHLKNTGQFGGLLGEDVDAELAWAINPGGSPDVVVAVIDDGMEISHPDLQPNVFINTNEVPGNGVDDDGNGWIDDVNGWDFTSNDNNPAASSIEDAHATSVAGVTAAVGDNTIGVTGIAYRSRLLPVRIFGDTGSATTDANIASAVYYAAGRTANGLGTWRAADITNNSWGGGAPNAAITAAFTWASTSGRNGRGVPSFIATGNGFATSISYPANLAGSISGVIAVGATTNLGTRSTYSNSGPQIDFVAPSSGPTYGGTFGIVTVDRQGTNGYNPAAGTAGDYTSTLASGFGGTSSATPLAAGIGALLMASDPNLTAAQIRGLMRNTTELIGPLPYVNGFNTEYGYGRVNAALALRGVGVAEVQVLDGGTEVSNGATIGGFSTLVGGQLTRTLRVRNMGSLPLTLGAASVTPGAFSIATPFGDDTLDLGEATTVVVAFAPTSAGAASGTLAFTTSDADEAVYTIALQGNGIPVNVSGVVFEDWDGDGVRDPGEAGLVGRQVYLDLNDNGTYEPSVATIAPNLPIPDNDPVGVTSSLNVPDIGLLGSVRVRLNITHTWVSDLMITLVSPAGTAVPLISARGGNGDNFTNTVLDDAAAAPISAGSAPFTGSFRPESPLAALVGQPTAGTWQLRVSDRAGSDIGTLVNWTLEFPAQPGTEPAVSSDANGFYSFTSLPTGIYRVRTIVPSAWNGTGPAGGTHVVDITTPDTGFTNRDFGQVRANAIYGQVFDDADGSGTLDDGETGLAGWTVFLDRNPNGVLDGDNTFTATPNVTIPDNNTTGITSSLTASGLSGGIVDVDVRLTITHTFVADLTVALRSPSGTTISLINRRGGNGDNFTNTVLDDEAAASITTITSPGAPFTGRFRPESPLAAVDGENPNGPWQLIVADRAGADVGTLVSWSLTFEREPTLVTPASGRFVFTGQPAGLHVLRQVNQAGWRRTVPATNAYQISLLPGGSSAGHLFGNVADAIPPTADIVDVTPDPRATWVPSIGITFSEPVLGFDLSDLSLTRDGAPVSLAGATLTGGGTSYTLGGISTITNPLGTYELTLATAGSGIVDLALNPLAANATDTWLRFGATTVLYTGTQIVNVGTPFTPVAQVASDDAACVANRLVTFTLDQNPLTGEDGPYVVGSALSSATGLATGATVPTSTWLEGVYTLTVTVAAALPCTSAEDQATVTVATPGNAAQGGGWYTLSGAGRSNFGFTVRATPDGPTTHAGRIVLINNGKWRLKGLLTSYSKTGGNGAATGTGDLFWWNATLNGGLGDWVLARGGVSFTASFSDAGTPTGRKNAVPDTFGIRIVYTPEPPQPGTLPNSAPTALKGGDVRVF